MSALTDPVVALLVLGMVLGVGVVAATLLLVGSDRSEAISEAAPPPVPRRGDRRTRRLDAALAASPALRRAVEITADLAERRGALGSLERSLRAADVPVRPAEVMLAHAAATVVAPLFVLLTTQSIPKTVIALVVAGGGPPYVLRFITKRRRKRFGNQLPDALTT
jgi:Flp pilus assembly protein TadB